MNYVNLISRVLLALIFVLAGIDKIFKFEMTQGYMEAMGVPGILIFPTIILEVVAGFALILGFQTKYAALALAVFCVLTGVIFHNNIADQMQFIMLIKNIAMAGGLLLLFEHGASHYSPDSKFKL
jgi:putative oxidoreductase